ncbi:MAG: 16S rRNA (adenine(1518)-N(6)/adenine(1519)-N(6))-dimethyltransferase RsmA [Cellvibrionaceae bacterium]|nr:16S rRNA (adenine(1518)-N(6)/adenine(1519)-N(6))-dimethyltransferase RsmA [Cellvibrionaceae bacterium]
MKQAPHSHRARKRFGQNFLVDPHVIRQIALAIRPAASEHVVEIGPGQGAITALLIDQCKRLDVVELDRDLVPGLLAQFTKYPGFQLHQGDALKFPFADLCREGLPLRIVGNLPYNISTPLIFYLLTFKASIKDMHFMLQKEVVQRLCAHPGEKHYGKLSVMTQYYCAVEELFDVAPGAFRPVPKVDSAIVYLRPHRQPPHIANNVEKLEFLVKQAFQFRRKTLRNCLRNMQSDVPIDELEWDLQLRAENLSVQDYVDMSNQLWL